MTTWTTIYLVIAVITGGLGLLSVSRGRNPYLGTAGLIWFVAILMRISLPSLSSFVIVRGLPDLGDLALYAAVPIFLILAYLYLGSRR